MRGLDHRYEGGFRSRRQWGQGDYVAAAESDVAADGEPEEERFEARVQMGKKRARSKRREEKVRARKRETETLR